MPRRKEVVVTEKDNGLIVVHRKRRAPLPKNESRREKLIRLLEPRVTRAKAEIRKVGQLFNTRVYDVRPSDLDAVESALDKAIAELRARGEVVLKKPRQERTSDLFRLQA